MRPQDLGPAYMSKVRECTNFVTWNAKKIAREVGPRPAGSETVRKAAEIVLPQTEKCADRIDSGTLTVRDGAETADCAVLGALLIALCSVQFFGLAIPALIVAAIGLLLTLACRFGRAPLFAFLAKSGEGKNSVMVREASGDAKKRVVFLGGLDSSRERRWLYVLGPGGETAIGVYALIGFAAGAALAAFALISGAKPGVAVGEWFRWPMLAFLPCAVALFLFVNRKQTSAGVISNLTGALTSAAVVKFLGDNNVRFEHTEVVSVMTDGRFAGCAGAKRFLSELDDKADTLVVALDSFCDPRGVSFAGKASPLAATAAERAETPVLDAKYALGASEASFGAKRGFETVTIFAPGDRKYYRTRDDELAKLNPKSVEQALHTAVELVYLFDER